MSPQTGAVLSYPPGGGAFSLRLQHGIASGPPRHEERIPVGKVDRRLELPLEELTFHRLTTAAEIAQILHLRGELQLPAAALSDPGFHSREQRRDAHGVVGAFRYRGTYIGTLRLIPMDRGLAPCESVLQGQSLVPAHYYDASWEVGRLVLAPHYRAGPEALKRCLFLALLYLVRNTEIANLFATCSPVLGRLYRRFGFSVLLKNACVGAADTYSLIHGDVPTVLRALAASGAERTIAEAELALLAGPQRAYA